MGSKLFQPLKVGKVTVNHRIAMAPLTRYRADDNHAQLAFVKEYYSQRGSTPGTLLVSEATFISAQASGYPNVPGLYDQAMVDAWKPVTAAVHAKGSFIFCQLWCLGRAAGKKNLESKGLSVVSSSDIPISPKSAVPRPLTEDEIQQLIRDYANAAKAAIEAGFDGVEIHGANGYMVDQFTQDTCNKRTDRWGGSIENRARFGIEVAKAVVAAIGADRVGIRLSPWSTFQAMRMEDPIPQFTYLIRNLKALNLAYLHLVTSRIQGGQEIENAEDTLDFAVQAWGNVSPVILAGGYSSESAKEVVDVTYKDYDVMVAFGRLFISTPDLPFRVKNGIALTRYERTTFYKAKSTDGYIDYPFSMEWEAAQSKL